MTGQGLLFGLVIFIVWTAITFPIVVRVSRKFSDRVVLNRLATGLTALAFALVFLAITVAAGPSFAFYGAVNLFVHQVLVTLLYLRRSLKQRKAQKRKKKEVQRYRPFMLPAETDALQGGWRLISSYDTMTEVEEYRQTQAEPDVILLNVDPDDLDRQTPASGLTFRINTDGSFSEQCFGRPRIEWYNDEGVSTDLPEPFSGTLQQKELGTFLKAASQQVESSSEYAEYFRYADGDTVVNDRLALVAGQLIRTVNVLVDEAYLYRCVYCYAKG